jgi:hypothetical protein
VRLRSSTSGPRREAPRPARLRALGLVACLGLAGLSPALFAPATACASTDQHAGLVVDTGRQATSYCVAIGAGTLSGMQLIQLAGRQYGLDYRLGFGGEAVCRLDDVGVSGADCFGAAPDFWGYWRGDGSGGWTWSSTGAADTAVQPGDVEGWSWGSGQDGSTHPEPPRATLSSVCGDPSPQPSSGPPPGDGGAGNGPGEGGNGGSGRGTGDSSSKSTPEAAGEGGSPTSSASSAGAGGATSGDRSAPTHRDGKPRPGTAATEPPSSSGEPGAPSPEAVIAASPVSDSSGSSGPPLAALLSLAAAVALGAGGWIYARRGAGRR